jgi:hypothetical protein
VDEVEFRGMGQDFVERQLHVRQRIAGVAKGPERLGHRLDVTAGHHRIAAREGRDLVAAAVKLRDQPVDDPLRPAVRPRRHTLERRGDLGDAERTSHGTNTLREKNDREGPPGGVPRGQCRTPGRLPGWDGSVGARSRAGRVVFLGLFLGLVARAGTAGRTDRATDDRAGRSGDGATGESTGSGATEGSGACTGLVVAFGRFTGDRATDGADRATDDGAGGATDGHADGCAAESTGSGADGFRAAFFILGGRATALVQQVVIVGVIVRSRRRVVVHWGSSLCSS